MFVAIELDESVRSALSAVGAKIAPACRGVRWIPAGQLHLTVKFLGEVPDADVVGTAAAVKRGASKSRLFDMEISGCGCFPPRGPVRIVWAGAHDASGTLLQTVASIEEELAIIGFEKERRPFSSHVTIGRVRSDQSNGGIRAAIQAANYKPVEQPVRSVTLMSSVLSPKGPAYAPVQTVGLG